MKARCARREWPRDPAAGMSGPADRIDVFPMPAWAHVPGETRGADHARLAPVKALVPARFDRVVPWQNSALRYGLALNDAGFFWECHEILEAVWAAAPQGGRDRILLRACIQIANANLKRRMRRGQAAARLEAEALAGLDELAVRGPAGAGEGFADRISTEKLAGILRQTGGRSVATSWQPVLLLPFLKR